MSIEVKTVDPDAASIEQAVEEYQRRFPAYAEALTLYGSVMEAQRRSLAEIECAADFSLVEIGESLKRAEPLLDPCCLELSQQNVRRVLSDICSAVARHATMASQTCSRLVDWKGLDPGSFGETRKALLNGDRLDFGESAGTDADAISLTGMIWESLVPFYRKCAQDLRDGIDHSLWQKGFCPVCGKSPLMGMFRPQDGLWLLECRLCHTLWNVHRASCPFCPGGSGGSLEYLYLKGYESYRVYYCGVCRRYVKNVDLRSRQGNAFLPLDYIVTELIGLDRVATQEGLKPA